jgi:hypothetical protein
MQLIFPKGNEVFDEGVVTIVDLTVDATRIA